MLAFVFWDDSTLMFSIAIGITSIEKINKKARRSDGYFVSYLKNQGKNFGALAQGIDTGINRKQGYTHSTNELQNPSRQIRGHKTSHHTLASVLKARNVGQGRDGVWASPSKNHHASLCSLHASFLFSTKGSSQS